MKISGQSAIVTGGGSGLGAAAARELAKSGAFVFVLDINYEAARAVADEVGGHPIKCDVSSTAQIEAAISEIERVRSPARIVMNIAGIGSVMKLLDKNNKPMPLDNFRANLNVNLLGTVDVIRLSASKIAELDPFDDGERGIIINTASIAAFEGQVGQAAYSASKGGVAALTLPLAREFSRTGIRVVCIAPGLFDTPLMETLPEEARASLSRSVPFPQRLGAPSEFARLAAHVVENTFINGEVIRLDGALRLAPR
jgi:NAD(P)-dependent dehydrogenase (short-subunit alcohol dehydrogenase family)